jgi:hypothetical protein
VVEEGFRGLDVYKVFSPDLTLAKRERLQPCRWNSSIAAHTIDQVFEFVPVAGPPHCPWVYGLSEYLTSTG